MSFKAASVLKECIELLEKDLSAALDKAHEVEEVEEDGDKIERKIIRKLYNAYRKDKIDILTFIELRILQKRLVILQIVQRTASDRVPIIVTKRKG